MKKLFILAVAAATFTITSCGSKSSEKAEAPEVEEVAEATDVDPVAELSEQLESGDANKFQTALTGLYEKAAQLLKDNPEKAKEYLSKAQDFLKENADKVTALVGDNETVKSVVNTLVEQDVESVANGLLQQIGVVQDAQEKVEEAKEVVDDAKAKVEEAKAKVEEAKENVENVKEAAKGVKDALGF